MSNYIKATFYEDEDIKVTLEEMDGYLMAHLTIYQFSKSVHKKVLSLREEIINRAYFSGYDAIYSYTADERIPRLIGEELEELGDFYFHGKNYKVWKWELKSPQRPLSQSE